MLLFVYEKGYRNGNAIAMKIESSIYFDLCLSYTLSLSLWMPVRLYVSKFPCPLSWLSFVLLNDDYLLI